MAGGERRYNRVKFADVVCDAGPLTLLFLILWKIDQNWLKNTKKLKSHDHGHVIQ